MDADKTKQSLLQKPVTSKLTKPARNAKTREQAEPKKLQK